MNVLCVSKSKRTLFFRLVDTLLFVFHVLKNYTSAQCAERRIIKNKLLRSLKLHKPVFLSLQLPFSKAKKNKYSTSAERLFVCSPFHVDWNFFWYLYLILLLFSFSWFIIVFSTSGCAACRGQIFGGPVKVGNKVYHQNCFVCATCGGKLQVRTVVRFTAKVLGCKL